VEDKLTAYLENVAEAGFACLITMVQGNLLTLGISHWIVASQTGLVAGAIAGTAIVTARIRRQWVISLMLGVATATVDYYVHRASFGTMTIAEAVATGVGAALLSYLASLLFMLWKKIDLPGRARST
jgi:hypothetical protein